MVVLVVVVAEEGGACRVQSAGITTSARDSAAGVKSAMSAIASK